MAMSLINNKSKTNLCEPCDICGKKVNDPLNFGDMMNKSNITVHYFCLLLSTHLIQAGKDCGGILGFLIADIKGEIKAAKKRSCMYCNEMGASIKCNHEACSNYFHLMCGIGNYCQHEFIGEFNSYCHKHVTIKYNQQHTEVLSCRICYEYMSAFNPINSIMATCCNKGWAHSTCMKKYALTSGYYLKCIWCKSPNFRDQIRKHGIFVPDRDAVWELDKLNYAGLYENYAICDAENCLAPHGRKNKPNQKYTKQLELLVCTTCGASGVHKLCYRANATLYTCADCINVFNKTILVNSIPTYRSLLDQHLELTIPSNIKEIETDFDNTLFIEKLHQNSPNMKNDYQDNSENMSDTCNGNETLLNLVQYNLTTKKVESVMRALVSDPNQEIFYRDELTILEEVDHLNDLVLNKELIMQFYNEVTEEEEEEKRLNDEKKMKQTEKEKELNEKQVRQDIEKERGLTNKMVTNQTEEKKRLICSNDIYVEDSDEEIDKSISDLLYDIINRQVNIQVPKPKNN